mgnify:CR=1 FL=1
MPVVATRFERRMRGGAQAHLLACSDGRFYVTKFTNNPQHRRILVNEWVSTILLKYLGVLAPEARVVELTPEFLAAEPEVCLQLGGGKHPVPPGWHYGSQYPGDPGSEAVYDFVPDVMLEQVANLDQFAGALVFDKWVANSDARQAIFFRRRIKAWLPEADAAPQQKGFIAQMIDHGYAFDGPNWGFLDAPMAGLYFRSLVYRRLDGPGRLEPWLARAASCPESIFDEILRTTPRRWIEGEEAEFERLITQLHARRSRVADLVVASARAKPDVFPGLSSRPAPPPISVRMPR